MSWEDCTVARTGVALKKLEQQLRASEKIKRNDFMQDRHDGEGEQLVEAVILLKMGDVIVVCLDNLLPAELGDNPTHERVPVQPVRRINTVGKKMEFPGDGDDPPIPLWVKILQVNHSVIKLLIADHEQDFEGVLPAIYMPGLYLVQGLFNILSTNEGAAKGGVGEQLTY